MNKKALTLIVELKDVFRQLENELEDNRETKLNVLPSSWGSKKQKAVLAHFGGKCPFTGKTSDLEFDHFVPVDWVHCGTYEGNMIPVWSYLNAHKAAKNPLEYYKDMDGLDGVLEYAAAKHGLTVDEYKEFVTWCSENPRTVSQALEDTRTSLEMWKATR
jgi:hypothetical protein